MTSAINEKSQYTTSVKDDFDVTSKNGGVTTITDEEVLLEKRFSLWSTIGMLYSLICSPLAIASFLSTVVGVGGSPVLIYGFIVAVTFDLIICFSLAEIAAQYPHSSAQIHWTSTLAPAQYKRVASYCAGILSCAGWIFASLSSSYIAAMFVIALAQIYHSDYVPEKWHYYLVYCFVIVSGYILNVFFVSVLPFITKLLIGIINGGTVFILIALLARTHPKQSGSYVFKNIVNETGWKQDGVVFFLGMLPSIACVTIFDGAAHMTDEVPNPGRNIPIVMVVSNVFGAISAFISAIIFMFCITNVDNLATPIGGQPIVQLMLDSLNSKALTTIGTLALILTFVGSSYGYITSTSRLFWSFSQAKGLPFPTYFSKIHPTFKVPVNALHLVAVLLLAIGTIIMGSATALAAVLGTAMVCINLSYIFPILALLVKKDRFGPNAIKGHFTLGKFGKVMNIISVVWAIFITVWLNFPSYYPVTTSNMNYACAVLGCTLIVGVILWFGYARKHFELTVSTVDI